MELTRRRGLAQKLRNDEEKLRLVVATEHVDVETKPIMEFVDDEPAAVFQPIAKGVCSKCNKYIGRGLWRHEMACKES